VVEIAKQVSYPVKLIWSREEDIQQGIFRPVTKCKLQASLLDKKITHWQSQLAHPGSKPKTATPKNIKQRLKHYLSQAKGMINNDQFTTLMGTRGLAKLSYAIENIDVTAHYSALDLPIGLWRSIDHSYNAFYIESFIDELAYTAEVDPYQFRAQHLQHSPRDLKVLQTVAKLANWHSMNTNQGIALHSCFNSHVAQIAEVAIQGSTIRVEKVYCAVDCGAVIDPEGVKQQIEGAIIYGLSAALYGEINLKDGSVQQSNFHDYRGISMLESPDMIIKIIDNPDTPPGGVGEIGTPCIAPAIANAVFAASKQRIRELPIVKALS